jgi:hypothetical protein
MRCESTPHLMLTRAGGGGHFEQSSNPGSSNADANVVVVGCSRAAWRLRQNTVGADYSWGALENILSFAGSEFADDVTGDCRMSTPADTERHAAGLEQMCRAWSEMNDGRSGMSCMVYSQGHLEDLLQRPLRQHLPHVPGVRGAV